MPVLPNLKAVLMLGLTLSVFWSCKDEKPIHKVAKKPEVKLFQRLKETTTGISFINHLKESTQAKYIQEGYRYMFNGGGVAIGDINNDGLKDVFFTANEAGNKLYLNQGGMQFKDISIESKVSLEKGWFTGVTMADVNADGYLDIYLCKSYELNPENRRNVLLINQKNGTFLNQATEMGLADDGFSTQAAFLDFDLDGLLDVYVLNHPDRWFMTLKISYPNQSRKFPNQDRLYRNQGNGTFKDISLKAGLIQEIYGGYGLGVTVADVDNDNDPDIYVSNDYESPDYLYKNNGDGTFTESLKKSFSHTSLYAMGNDIADYNNDGLVDICVLDMAPEKHYRSKTQMKAMDPQKFQSMIDAGLPYQYMYNTLQTNRGNGRFSDLGQMAGVAKTDWSWGPLLADFDRDGRKDLFVTNGFRVDDMDKDYWNRAFQKYGQRLNQQQSIEVSTQMLREMPSTKLSNYIFQNTSDFKFTKKTKEWGLDEKSFSQGGAYGDLDNDGDLDLVINNLNEKAWIYQNMSELVNPERKYLNVKLKGSQTNTFGFGAKLKLISDQQNQIQEISTTRGFQSAVPPEAFFGMQEDDKIQYLEIIWPDGRIQQMTNVVPNQSLTIEYEKSLKTNASSSPTEPDASFMFQTINPRSIGLEYTHKENPFDDYEREVLLPYKYSMLGPKIAHGDVNGDGLVDIYVGGAINQSGQLFIQLPSGRFKRRKQPWKEDAKCEDMDALFFDFDQDGDHDLYVISGGNEYPVDSKWLHDRLYENDGKGNFVRSDVLPSVKTSGGVVISADVDLDGDLDLFVGGRQIPGQYGMAAKSQLLINDQGGFVDGSSQWNTTFDSLGMITDALWTDIDSDGYQDLIIVGEWMSPAIFLNQNGEKFKLAITPDLARETGWWNCITSGDFDEDGDLDFVIGNLGENYKYKASKTASFKLYVSDFDENGQQDIVLGYYEDGNLYPLRGRQCSAEQVPGIATKFQTFSAFGSATLEDIYGENIHSSFTKNATNFSTSYIENLGDLQFKVKRMDASIQFSSVNAILSKDINEDGHLDLILSGNLFQSEIETPRNDASLGNVLLGDGKSNFEVLETYESRYITSGDVKDIQWVERKDKNPIIIVGNNNDALQVIECIINSN